MKLGAENYISSPSKLDELLIIVKRALDRRKLQREVEHLRHAFTGRYDLSKTHRPQQAHAGAVRVIKRVSQGETRPCSSWVDRNRQGARRARHPFQLGPPGGAVIPITARRSPRPVMESELFGHQKGAFTRRARIGGPD